ncbi:hypothetical protein L208DRAFT_1387158 [Tricholoma matsutake]|nr:hypothetical protein L208DRAFT_1387158 [Tricholoma matsutake 945]
MIAPGSPVRLQAHDHPRIHSCRWAWCCLSFSINAELVHHVIHDHVRQAVPVFRKDIPMLRRVEEGIGESMSGFGTSYTTSHPNHEDQLSGGPTSKKDVYDSSLPSPPSPPLLTSSDGETGNSSPDSNASQPPPPHMQQTSSPNMASRPGTPTKSQPLLARSPESKCVTPTFALLPSPAGSPVIRSVPGSPSFDSLLREATNGKRKREDEHFSLAQSLSSQWQNSQESHNSLSSSGSQDSVEKQLTQSMDVNDDEGRGQVTQPQPENCAAAFTPAQTEEISYKGELQWAAESSQMAASNSWSSQGTSSLAPLQTQVHSPSMPMRNIHTPTTSAQRQAWYGTLPSHKKRKSWSNSSLSASDVHQSDALTGFCGSKPSAQAVHSFQDANPHSDVEPVTPRSSGNVFQSGTLQITPTKLESVQPEHGGSPADYSSSQSRSSIGWSQSQSQTSWLGRGSYSPFQTQAPYQSQSTQC